MGLGGGGLVVEAEGEMGGGVAIGAQGDVLSGVDKGDPSDQWPLPNGACC